MVILACLLQVADDKQCEEITAQSSMVCLIQSTTLQKCLQDQDHVSHFRINDEVLLHKTDSTHSITFVETDIHEQV